MGERQKNLKTIILDNFIEFKHHKLNLAELRDSLFFNDVHTIYNKLRGQFTELPLKYGSWDISTEGFIIELDEERHFNRYRLETLSSKIYRDNNYFLTTSYKTYCKTFEDNCLKAAGWGGNWKNNSTERMFVKSEQDKDLTGNGSSRWRQRAYYDFLKDVTGKIRNIPVIRVSIYDVYKGRRLNDLLINNENKLITNFVEELIRKF